MKPDMAVCFGAVRQQRIAGSIWVAALDAMTGYWPCRIAIEPFGDATGEGLGLGRAARQSAVELGNAGAFVKVGEPVLAGPTVRTRSQQGGNAGLLTGECVEDAGGWPSRCLQ